jgi:dipeptidyl aminopeptidase/acylaminoacyl peptidase
MLWRELGEGLMQSGIVAALAAASIIAAVAPAVAAPVDAYGELPVMGMVRLSPDGSRLAYVVPVKGGNQGVVVESLDPAKQISALSATDQKVRNLIWADNDHLIVLKSHTGIADFTGGSMRSEWPTAQVLDIAKKKVTPLLDPDLKVSGGGVYGGGVMNVVGGAPMPRVVNGKTVVFAEGIAFVDSSGVPALFSVDLSRDVETMVERAQGSNEDRTWMVDGKGQLLSQVTYDQTAKQWTLRLRRGDGWIDAFQADASIDVPEVEGVSADGASLILSVPDSHGVQYKAVALANGAITNAPVQYEAFDDEIVDPVTRRIIGGTLRDADQTYRFIDPADEAAWKGILAAFPGEDVRLASWSDNRRKVVVEVTGQTHGVIYVLIDLDAHKAVEVGQAYQNIGPQDVAGVETIVYKAADGRGIPAYLTLPNGKDPKNLPLIVLPHGGPEARDVAGFDWWAQALASRGYAVLQPQFRGSGDLGRDLLEAGYGEFGRKMQTDLSDGVAALAKAGMIDPKRVCIVGASYGGYAALAGVTLQSGIYRCAVAVAGLSDLRKMWATWYTDVKTNRSVRYWDRYLGVKSPSDPVVEQYSPIKYADKVTVPVLLIHGRDDTVVPFDQSQGMVDALNAAHKQVQFVILSHEDHWLSRAETRAEMLEATVKFLEANNPPT